MTNMSLFDHFISIIDHVFMNLEHSVGGGDMMIKAVVVFMFNLFQSVLDLEGNKLAKLIFSFEFRGASIFDPRESFENDFKL